MNTKRPKDWYSTVPACLDGVDPLAGLEVNIAMAEVELDLIAEGQDGTEHYTKRDVAHIRRWIAKAKRML